MPASGLLLIGLYTLRGENRSEARVLVRQALDDATEGADISISHASGFSVAAVHRHGPVGIDVMELDSNLMPDWFAVAHDYLGPAATARLTRCDDDHRAHCFAREWTQREAQLKLHGCGLVEWKHAPDICDGSCVMLALPEGYVGAVAAPRAK